MVRMSEKGGRKQKLTMMKAHHASHRRGRKGERIHEMHLRQSRETAAILNWRLLKVLLQYSNERVESNAESSDC